MTVTEVSRDQQTKELAISTSQAEEALAKHQGDVTKALTELMSPPSQKSI